MLDWEEEDCPCGGGDAGEESQLCSHDGEDCCDAGDDCDGASGGCGGSDSDGLLCSSTEVRRSADILSK